MRIALTTYSKATVLREYRDLVSLRFQEGDSMFFILMGHKGAKQLSRAIHRCAESAKRHSKRTTKRREV